MCGGTKVVTTPALDSVHIKGARIASAGTMYKPSSASLLHCTVCPLTGRQKAERFQQGQPIAVQLHKAEKLLPGSGWCKATSFLEAMAPEPSLQEKQSHRFGHLRLYYPLPKKLSFLVTRDTLLSKVPGWVQVAKCSQVTAPRRPFSYACALHMLYASFLSSSMQEAFHGWHRRYCSVKPSGFGLHVVPNQLPQSRTRLSQL